MNLLWCLLVICALPLACNCDEKVHFKIIVPEFIKHIYHKKIVYIHDKKKPEHKEEEKHHEEKHEEKHSHKEVHKWTEGGGDHHHHVHHVEHKPKEVHHMHHATKEMHHMPREMHHIHKEIHHVQHIPMEKPKTMHHHIDHHHMNHPHMDHHHMDHVPKKGNHMLKVSHHFHYAPYYQSDHESHSGAYKEEGPMEHSYKVVEDSPYDHTTVPYNAPFHYPVLNQAFSSPQGIDGKEEDEENEDYNKYPQTSYGEALTGEGEKDYYNAGNNDVGYDGHYTQDYSSENRRETKSYKKYAKK